MRFSKARRVTPSDATPRLQSGSICKTAAPAARSKSSTVGSENKSPEGSNLTIGSRVQARRQSRVVTSTRAAASGLAASSSRSAASKARPRPSASQRGPTQTRSRRHGREGSDLRRRGRSGAFEFVFHHENAHEGRRCSQSPRRWNETSIDLRRLTSRIKLTGDKFEGGAPRQSEISLRHGGYVI